MQAPDAGHDHAPHHGTGISWLDMVLGISAIFISVVSLVVSVQHGRTMEKMVEQNEKLVAASTLPFLSTFGTQVDSTTFKPEFVLVLKNGGVGPAVIDSFQLRYKNKAYSNPNQLLRDCCAAALPHGSPIPTMDYSNVSGTVLPARESISFLELRPGTSPELLQAVEAARPEIDLSACFCSVLDQCWQTDFSAGRPKPVPACPLGKDQTLW